jgi:hypothetical protein
VCAVSAKFLVLVIGSFEGIALEHCDIRASGINENKSSAFRETFLISLEFLAAVYVRHAPDECEIRLLGMADQFLQLKGIVVNLLVIPGVDFHWDSDAAESACGFRKGLRIRRLDGEDDDFHYALSSEASVLQDDVRAALVIDDFAFYIIDTFDVLFCDNLSGCP